MTHLRKYYKPQIYEKKINFTLLYGIFDYFPEEVLAQCGYCTTNSYCQSCLSTSNAFCNDTGECGY